MAATRAPDRVLAFNEAIAASAGLNLGSNGAHAHRAGFPEELSAFCLGELLEAIRLLGGFCSLPSGFERAELKYAMEISTAVGDLLAQWPDGFRELIRTRLPVQSAVVSSPLAVRAIFGRAYVNLYAKHSVDHLEFVRRAFEESLLCEWRGIVRADYRSSVETRFRMKWCARIEASRLAGAAGASIALLIPRHNIDTITVAIGARTTTYFDRRTLNAALEAFITFRDSHLSFSATCERLGLSYRSLNALVVSGVLRCESGKSQGARLHHRRYFNAADVERVVAAFDAPSLAYSKPGPTITLENAVWGLIGRNDGFPRLVHDCVVGKIKPIGKTNRYPGIRGAVFSTRDIESYSRACRPEPRLTNDRPISQNDAAVALRITPRIVSSLLREGLLSNALGERRVGALSLISAASVAAFAREYISAAKLASATRVTRQVLVARLRREKIPFVLIPKCKPNAIFLRVDDARPLMLPTTRLP